LAEAGAVSTDTLI